MELAHAPDLLDGHSAAAAMLADAHAHRVAADRAEAMILRRATDWADLHPAPEGSPGAFDDDNLPAVAWDATAEFAMAVRLSDDAGSRFLHEALELRQRLPHIWARVMAGDVQSWRARRIAQATMGHPGDVADHVDRHLVNVAHKVGPVTTARLLDEAMLRLYPEQREQEQLEALDARHATLYDQVSTTGIAHMDIDADLKDLVEFDDALAAVAAALADQGCAESLDVRRSLAVGVLADPQGALDLLAPAASAEGGARPEGSRSQGSRRPRKRLVLHVHLTDSAIAGLEPVGRCETGNQAVLEQQIRVWCGRTDSDLVVKPVIDLNDHLSVEQYEVPDRLKARVGLRDHHCAFPWCTRTARRCDHDHAVPHAAGGATCTCNLAPLCRRHHRLKTLTRWAYTTIEPGVFLWTAPHGRQYLRDHTGTLDVTPVGRSPGEYDGCQHPPDG